ncbi:PREDICTED: putative fatty acyl-CoA reductase CG5065 [Dinoponera quadriceps]|uniref:Fatty acyl-CoA reductase n=1 Tax=Dinoponera quadriceps TaxID=609295 RepID=A0A6P3XRP4_DINQU|nr:PREDICTED: putative fatty acyl-CoA reductase CG5065 [Dinoponera quadriceps]
MNHYGNNVMVQKTPIQTFYAGQSIFITGGTGFLGKILIEKLLRSCPDISKIYLLIRSKKGKNIVTRLNEIFEYPIFNHVGEKMPNFRDKIVPITGELNEIDLGFTKSDKDLLIREISIVFHLAASVRFNNDIKVATIINVIGTRAMLDLAKCMPNLKSFIHVSTVFTNCHIKHIEERFYEYVINPEKLITLIRTSTENTINETLARVAPQGHNTYTFTKAIAEIVVRDNSGNLPIGIFRPAVVINAAHEPLAGWVDNYHTMMGFLAPFSKGLLRFIRCDNKNKIHFMPVDITVNALIASAWDVFNQPKRRGDKMLIYNSVSMNNTPLKLSELYSYAEIACEKYPANGCYWLPTLTLIKNKFIYTVCIWFCHLLPALIIDIFAKFIGARQSLWKLYGKIHDFCKLVEFFIVNEWSFDNSNIRAMWQNMNKSDQLLYNFNMKSFDWLKYSENVIKGMQLYLFKDDFSTLEVSRDKWKRLYWIHHTTKLTFIFIVGMFLWKLLTITFL